MQTDVDEKKPHLLNQEKLNDLVRYLIPSKSRVTQFKTTAMNLLQEGTKVLIFRNRSAKLSSFYNFEATICHYTNATALMEELGTDHVAKEWRLFIDYSKASLKAVVLHNGNKTPSIPQAHAVGMKKTHDFTKLLLDLMI